MMAGLDGINKKIEPAGAGRQDLPPLRTAARRGRGHSASPTFAVRAVIDRLEGGPEYLPEGGVFTPRTLHRDVDLPTNAVRTRSCRFPVRPPHAVYEIALLYFDGGRPAKAL